MPVHDRRRRRAAKQHYELARFTQSPRRRGRAALAALRGRAPSRLPACGACQVDRGPLKLLAASRDGATEAIMLAHGFTLEMLVELVRAGLAPARPSASRAAF
jgi:sulfur relay (sulfurtransferase) complex TusBCD TusD component (DsrE family)